MKISVIIPVINEAASIQASVDCAWRAGADEVIVVDGGSQDDTTTICQSLDCSLIQSPAGRGIQLNAGTTAATGDVFVFLHADNSLAADALAQIKRLPEPQAELFGGFRQRIQNDRTVFRWIESGNAMRVRWRGLVYGDQAMFVSRQLFESAGGFPSIPLMEDLAFSRRAKKLLRPILLPGPTHVNSRRWERNGAIRQTLQNWILATAFLFGARPDRLAEKYRRHDLGKDKPD